MISSSDLSDCDGSVLVSPTTIRMNSPDAELQGFIGLILGDFFYFLKFSQTHFLIDLFKMSMLKLLLGLGAALSHDKMQCLIIACEDFTVNVSNLNENRALHS